MPRGWSTSAAHAMIASDRQPAEREPDEHVGPLGQRSLRVHCSSTAPEEKKNTSYGVIAAPNSAIA